MSVQRQVPSSRAEAVAAQEGYGAHRSSYRVNRAHDRHQTIGVLMLPIGAAVFLWMAWDASPWNGGESGASMSGMLASGIAGLIFLALTLCLAVPLLVGRFRVESARVHVYEHGAIAERPGGNLYAWALTRATARYVCWQQSWEGEWRDRPQLWVTFHEDGETICFDGLDPQDRAVLPEIARAFGISDRPEPIGERHPAKVPTPF